MSEAVVLALIALASASVPVIIEKLFDYFKDKRGRQDKKDEAHEEIKADIAETNRRVDDVAGIAVTNLRYNITDLERACRNDGYKTELDDMLFNELLVEYHECVDKCNLKNGKIDSAVERWKQIPLK